MGGFQWKNKLAKRLNLKQNGQFSPWMNHLNQFKICFLGEFLLFRGLGLLFEQFFFPITLKLTKL